jgi:hypothetical protein
MVETLTQWISALAAPFAAGAAFLTWRATQAQAEHAQKLLALHLFDQRFPILDTVLLCHSEYVQLANLTEASSNKLKLAKRQAEFLFSNEAAEAIDQFEKAIHKHILERRRNNPEPDWIGSEKIELAKAKVEAILKPSLLEGTTGPQVKNWFRH